MFGHDKWAVGIIATLFSVTLIAGLIYSVNYHAYHQGYNDAILTSMKSKAKIENDYRSKINALGLQVTAASNERDFMAADLDRISRLQRDADTRNHSGNTAAPSKPDAAIAVWKNRFDMCERDYIRMVSDTARYADIARGLQEYSNAITK